MKKINIIKESKEFEKIINGRRHYVNKYFNIYIMKKEQKYFRFGITVPKKIGDSVVRNKIKRQIKSILYKNIRVNKDLDYVIIVRKEILTVKYKEMLNQLNLLLEKINGACQNEKI